jgi:hypothetical protein
MIFRISTFTSLITLAAALGIQPVSGDELFDLKWKKHTINDVSPFEAAGVGDFNADGRLDVFCGDSWYAGPDWTPFKVRDVPRGSNPHYHEDFADATLDVNGDGKLDIVTCSYFSRKVAWVEQPSDPHKPWTEHLIDSPGPMETAYLVDLYGDGTPVFLPNVGGKVAWYELSSRATQPRWDKRQPTAAGGGHGIGHGDINGDGRIDIITPKGWCEQPADRNGDWTFHGDFELGAASIGILGHDFDRDGNTDVVWGMGHGFGLHWLRQKKDADGKRVWHREDIDTQFSQVHTLHLADFDGDNEIEFVTGKRIYAHESEAGATDKPCIYVFKFHRQTGNWIKNVVYEGEPAPAAPLKPEQRDALKDFRRGSAGTGLQMVTRDLDQDGDLDIVAPGKSGLYWFENLRVNVANSPK